MCAYKKYAIQSLMITTLFISISFVQAQETPVWKKGDIWPFPKIELQKIILLSSAMYAPGVYIYCYALYNSTFNTLPLSRLQIDLRDNPLAHPMSSKDLTIGHDSMAHYKMLMDFPRVKLIKKINPNGWEFDVHVKRIMDGVWRANQDGVVGHTTLMPGETLSGFCMEAIEPIGIREFAVDADMTLLEPYFDAVIKNPTDLDFYLKSEEFRIEDSKGIEFLGKTIAPVTPPEPFTASTWTARMESYAIEARKLGWIKTDEQLKQIKIYLLIQ